jgi:hypothetical protein
MCCLDCSCIGCLENAVAQAIDMAQVATRINRDALDRVLIEQVRRQAGGTQLMFNILAYFFVVQRR